MPYSLPNGRQTDSTVDELSRVHMPKLVERAGDICLRAVVVPALLYRLVAQRPSSPVLLRSEQWPMCVAHPFQVRPELLYQTWIVEQDRPPYAAFSHDRQMLIVERKVNILHVQGEPFVVSSDGQLQGPMLRSSELTTIIYWMYRAEQRSSYIIADPQAGLQEQTEEESVTLTLGGNGFENAFNLVALHATRLRLIEFHPLNLEHRVAVEQFVLMRPGEEARYGGLFTCPRCGTEVKVRMKEIPQYLRCHRVHWPVIERTQLR